jgi:hypothetical protein
VFLTALINQILPTINIIYIKQFTIRIINNIISIKFDQLQSAANFIYLIKTYISPIKNFQILLLADHFQFCQVLVFDVLTFQKCVFLKFEKVDFRKYL